MSMDHTRDPCPWVILNDFGGAFAMGVRLNHPLFLRAQHQHQELANALLTGNRRHDLARHQGIPQ